MKKRTFRICFLLFLSNASFEVAPVLAQGQGDIVQPVQFTSRQIASESFESVAVFDVDNDGVLDIVSGSYWYEGPEFLDRSYIGDVERAGEYWDDFLTIPVDVNGDGNMDYITGGWFSQSIFWVENSGDNSEWDRHLIDETGNVETGQAWDIDGDGFKEIVPNNPNDPLRFYMLDRDENGNGDGTFTRVDVHDAQDHGLGFGDINGDGRGDFIVSEGWIEAPDDVLEGEWILHEDFDLGTASIPILVADVNGDSRNDFIVGKAHSYGLDWYEQTSGASGGIDWVRHPIDPNNSQFHTMDWVDIDGDGRPELITGKRYRPHNGNDPGANDPLGLYYYKWNGDSFVKNTISYGPFGKGKGTGIYFDTADLRGTGRLDIIVAGKDGLYVFFNEGRVEN